MKAVTLDQSIMKTWSVSCCHLFIESLLLTTPLITEQMAKDIKIVKKNEKLF